MKTHKLHTMVLVALAVAAMLPGAAPAAAPVAAKDGKQKDKPALSGVYLALSGEVKATAKQQEELLRICGEEKKTVTDVTNRNEKDIRAIKDRLDKAKPGSSTQKTLQQELDRRTQSAKAEEDRVVAPYRKRAFTVLTTEQRAAWGLSKLYPVTQTEFGTVGLSEEQAKSVKKLCEQAGNAADTINLIEDPKIVDDLIRRVVSTILNPAQQQKYSTLLSEREKAKHPGK